MSITLATVSCSECGKTLDMMDLRPEMEKQAERLREFTLPTTATWHDQPILELVVPDGWRWSRHSGLQHCSNKCYGTWLARQPDE